MEATGLKSYDYEGLYKVKGPVVPHKANFLGSMKMPGCLYIHAPMLCASMRRCIDASYRCIERLFIWALVSSKSRAIWKHPTADACADVYATSDFTTRWCTSEVAG